MRVIGGELSGRRLKSVDRPLLRPTTDRVRESIFNVVSARLDLEGSVVLDLFAGTGALGIEALSRGATHASFVEKDRKTAALIRENLTLLGIADRAEVVVRDVDHHLRAVDRAFDLILADPPYAASVSEGLIGTVHERALLAERGLLVIEHSSALASPVSGALEIVVRKEFGDTAVSIYRSVPAKDAV